MRILDYFLARLAGIPHTRIDDFREGLQSPRALAVLLLLVILRARRGLRKCVNRVADNAGTGTVDLEKRTHIPGYDERAVGQAGKDKTDCPENSGALPTTGNDTAFPKLIFQTWKSRHSVPDNYVYWSATLKKMLPAFDYYLWDDRDNRSFIAQNYPWFLPVYDRYPREIYRVDAVRYFFLYQFGGLYVDMDTECLRPLNLGTDSGDVWLGRMGNDADFSHSIPNAIMASRPRQEFWLLVIHLLIQKADSISDPGEMAGHGPEALTGPVLLKQAVDIYQATDRAVAGNMIAEVAARLPASMQPDPGPSRVIIHEPGRWYPIDWTNLLHFHLASEVVDHGVTLSAHTLRWLFPKASLVTYWTHSWKPENTAR